MNEPEPVSMERWGKDHWSTLAYIETRTVDYKGVLENAKLRVAERLHREFKYVTPFGGNTGKDYPTILAGGEKLSGHDDVSCILDMAQEGLLTYRDRYKKGRREEFFNNREIIIKLTPKGQALTAELRAHKAAGGSFGNFVPAGVPA